MVKKNQNLASPKTIKIEKIKLHFVNLNYILTLRKVLYPFLSEK